MRSTRSRRPFRRASPPPRVRPGAGARRAVLVGAALGWGLLSAACQPAGDTPWVSPVAFDTAEVWVVEGADSARLLVELATSEQQRQFGLSRRPSLDPESGMLFLFDEPRAATDGFWMWQTRISLDIAFLDSAGVVQAVLQMEPCTATYANGCTPYEPGVAYASALEANVGWFEAKGFGVGSRVLGIPDITP